MLWCPAHLLRPHQFSPHLQHFQQIVPATSPPHPESSPKLLVSALQTHTHSRLECWERASTDDAGGWCINPPCLCLLGKAALSHSLPCFLASPRRIALQVPATTCVVSLSHLLLKFPGIIMPTTCAGTYLRVCFWRALTCLLWETRAGIPFARRYQLFLLCLGHTPWRKAAQNAFQWLVYTSGCRLAVIAIINNFKYPGWKWHPPSNSQFHRSEFTSTRCHSWVCLPWFCKVPSGLGHFREPWRCIPCFWDWIPVFRSYFLASSEPRAHLGCRRLPEDLLTLSTWPLKSRSHLCHSFRLLLLASIGGENSLLIRDHMI